MLRMRENSLFAILLRGSWVYSALIAVALIIAVYVFTKGHYTYFGVAMAIPFLVISGRLQADEWPGNRLLEETDEWVRAARAANYRRAYRRIPGASKVEPFKGKAAELRLKAKAGCGCCVVSASKPRPAGGALQSLVAAGEHHEAAGLILWRWENLHGRPQCSRGRRGRNP